ncbi:MAG: GTPase Era [Alphaproteobacteria bacterium]|nr:GTPase Era [Alphaproteobacteria bacterium]
MKRCGFVAVIGETNAGKSTLVNKLVGQKVSIVSRKVQTTLTRILGIALYGESQVILADTPGFVSKMQESVLEKTIWDTFRESEQVLFVVDVNKRDFSKSVALIKKIHDSKKISLVLNKVDLIHKPKLLEIASMFSQIRLFENIFMVSGITDIGIDDIRNYLERSVPEGNWLFPNDEVTDSDFETFVSEITREHLYHRIHKEIPYRCKVKTIFSENKPDGSVIITQHIYVNSAAHRAILVGNRGAKIRAIGEASRRELSQLLDKTVHLFLQVVLRNER